jgi:hypothetical protein
LVTVASALAMLVAGFALTVGVVGGITFVVMLLLGYGIEGLYFSNPADPSTWEPDPALPDPRAWPVWVAPSVILLAGLVGVLAAIAGPARLGAGSFGDHVTGVSTLTVDGADPGRHRALLRVALHWAVLLVVGALFGWGWGLLSVLAVWAPAVGPSRRSVVDRLLGLVPLVQVDAKLGVPFGTRRPD